MLHERIGNAVLAERERAESLFRQLAEGSKDRHGETRDTYAAGENFAHDLLREYAAKDGLEATTDAAQNTYVTWPGVSRHAPRIFIGSHLDSVPNGGNFDGAAGVVAGLTVTAALRAVGVKPACDIVTTGVRAEESVWFQVSYIGSRSALGTLPEAALDARRVDTNCTLAEHMSASGAQSERLRRKERALDPLSIRAFWKFISSKRQRWSNSAYLSRSAATFRAISATHRRAFSVVTATSGRR